MQTFAATHFSSNYSSYRINEYVSNFCQHTLHIPAMHKRVEAIVRTKDSNYSTFSPLRSLLWTTRTWWLVTSIGRMMVNRKIYAKFNIQCTACPSNMLQLILHRCRKYCLASHTRASITFLERLIFFFNNFFLYFWNVFEKFVRQFSVFKKNTFEYASSSLPSSPKIDYLPAIGFSFCNSDVKFFNFLFFNCISRSIFSKQCCHISI